MSTAKRITQRLILPVLLFVVYLAPAPASAEIRIGEHAGVLSVIHPTTAWAPSNRIYSTYIRREGSQFRVTTTFKLTDLPKLGDTTPSRNVEDGCSRERGGLFSDDVLCDSDGINYVLVYGTDSQDEIGVSVGSSNTAVFVDAGDADDTVGICAAHGAFNDDLAARGGEGNDHLHAVYGSACGSWRPDGRLGFSGGPGNDTLDTELEVPLRLDGGEGNDTLWGSRYTDSLDGGPGNDALTTGYGFDPDTAHGGEGDDRVLVTGRGRNQIYGDDGDDIINSIFGGGDSLYGGLGNDQIFGGRGIDLISGNDGDDILNGEQDVDLLVGGRGNDELRGGEDNDLLFDSSGTYDLLSGGEGNDMLDSRDDSSTTYSYDAARGETGDDSIYTQDGQEDGIDCDEGTDRVLADPLNVDSRDQAECEL